MTQNYTVVEGESGTVAASIPDRGAPVAQPLPAPDQLILDAAEGRRQLTADELQQVLEHVAQAGFDPTPSVRAKGLAGLLWQGRLLTGRDLMTSAERHFLRHVVRFQEWPPGTGLADYLSSVRDIILDPMSSVLVSRYLGSWQLGVVRESLHLRGPGGLDWVLVEYRVALGRWVTAYQVPTLQDLHSPERTHVQWLRPPT
jgi:hypothetical protein